MSQDQNGKAKPLGRAAILDADDLKFDAVEVPEWGGIVRVRTLTGRERDDFEAAMMNVSRQGTASMNVDAVKGMRARLVVLCAVDEDGERLFTDEDEKALQAKSADAIATVFKCAARLNGMSEEGADELLGESEAGPAGDSSSD